MKKTLSLLMILVIYVSAIFAQNVNIEGEFKLQGVYENESIKILINSNTANYNLYAESDKDGSYKLTIPKGNYNICFYKNYFEPVMFRSIQIEADHCFNRIFLESNPEYRFFDEDTLSGVYNSGVLNIMNDAVIPEGEALTITGDASLHFPIEKNMNVYGALNLIGTYENPLNISTDVTNPDFRFIYGKYEADSIFVNYVVFNGFKHIFTTLNHTTKISNSTFYNTRVLCNSYHDTATVYFKNCTVYGDGYATVALKTNRGSYMSVKNSYFTGINPFYVFEESTMDFDSCFVENCGLSLVKHHGFLRASFSVFRNCFDPIGCATTTTAYFDHCTFLNNNSAIRFREYENIPAEVPDTSLYLSNCIITNCNYSIWNWCAYKYLNGFINYNVFHNTDLYDLPFVNTDGFAELTNNNFNGDTCDIYQNIFFDPNLNEEYVPLWGSPVINAGDPEFALDPDNTITDIGAYFYDLNSGIEGFLSSGMVVSCFPVPAIDQINFLINHSEGLSGVASISVYSNSGSLLYRTYQPVPATEKQTTVSVTINEAGLTTGNYIYTIEIPGQETVGGKLTVVK